VETYWRPSAAPRGGTQAVDVRPERTPRLRLSLTDRGQGRRRASRESGGTSTLVGAGSDVREWPSGGGPVPAGPAVLATTRS